MIGDAVSAGGVVVAGVLVAATDTTVADPIVSLLSPRDHRRAREGNGAHLLASCGRPFRQREVRLVDDSAEIFQTLHRFRAVSRAASHCLRG